MASKSISMTLSLTDKATPELQKFMKSLQGLESMLANLNKSFQAFNAGIAGVSSGATAAASSMGAATNAASSLESKVAQAATAMKAFAGASGEAAAAAGLASTEINKAGGSVESFEGKMRSLGHTIRGVAEIWAASKIGHGLEEAVKSASNAQDTQARIRNIGGAEVQALVNDAVDKARKAVPQIEKTELAKMALDIYAASGHKESIGDLGDLAKSVYVMQKSDASGQFGEQSTLNLFKALELRGSMLDPSRRDQDLEQMMKSSIATQGRVGPDQFYMFLKTLKNGENQGFDKSFFSTATALIEEMGASRAATMINAMQRTVTGSQIKKELIPNWKELGLVSADGKSMKYLDEFRANPVKFIQDHVLPALQKKGVDTSNETEISKASTKLFGNQNGQEGLYVSLARTEQLKKQAELVESVSGKEAAYAEISGTASAAADKFHASLDAFGQVIGTTILPVLTDLLDLATKVVDFFAGAAKDPIVAWGITIASVMSAAVLALNGFIAVFGFLAPAAEGAAVGMAAPIAAFVSKFGPWAIAAVASFTAGFVFWDAIKNFEVFGTTIENFATQMVVNLMRIFDQFITYLNDKVFSGIEAIASVGSNLAAKVGMSDTSDTLSRYAALVAGERKARERGYQGREKIRQTMDSESDAKAQALIKENRRDKSLDALYAAEDANGDEGIAFAGTIPKKKTGTPHWDGDDLKNKNGKGRNPNDIAANIESENAKFEREKTALELKATEALYREHEISIEAYFDKKVETIKSGTAAEIAALEKEKATLEKDPARNADKINAANHKIILAQMKERQDLLDVETDKRKALQSLTSEGLNLEQKLESLTKSASNAKIALLDIEYQKKRKLLEVNGDLRAMQALDDLHTADVAKVKYDDLQTKNNLFKGGEKIAEMQANADAKKGLITTYEAQQKIVEAKREQGAQELINLDAMMQYAEKIRDPALVQAIQQARIEAQGLVDTLDVGAEQFKNTFHSAIEGGINDLLNGKFSFRKFFASISQQLNATLAKNLSDTITNTLFGAGGMLQGAGGGGSLLAGLFGGGTKSSGGLGSLFGSLFGGGASFDVGSQAAGLGMDVGSLLMSFDVGTDRVSQDMIAQIHKDEMILPAATANRVRDRLASGGGGGGGVNQTNHFHMPQGGYDRRTQDQIAKTALQAAQRAGRRDG